MFKKLLSKINVKSLLFVHYLAPLCIALSCTTLSGNTLGIRALAVGQAGIEKPRYVKVGNSYQSLTFHQRQPGQLITTESSLSLPIYEKIKKEGEPPSYKISEKVTIPEGAKTVLILAFNRNGKCKFRAVEDKLLDASYNEWLLINTTSKPIDFQLGTDEKSLRIDKNDEKFCRVNVPPGGSATALGRAEWNGKMKTFYSTYWPIRAGERSIVIFVEIKPKIAVKRIGDALLKPKPKPKADADENR